MAMMDSMEMERDMEASNLVFVYGTLKKGYANHGLLEGAEFLGEATSKDARWNLVDLGPFPAMTYGHTAVRGEVYAIDSSHLRALDRLEGYPQYYDRNVVDFTMGDTTVAAWVYWMPTLVMRNDSEVAQLAEW